MEVGTDGGNETPIPELAEAGGWRSWSVTPNGIYYTDFAAQPPFHIKFFDFATHQTKEVTTAEKLPLLYYSNLSGFGGRQKNSLRPPRSKRKQYNARGIKLKLT